MSQPVSEHPSGAVVEVYVQPRSSRTEIVGVHDGALRLRIAAPPVDGAANVAVIDLLSRATGTRKSDIDIISGHSSRRKRVLLCGADAASVATSLGVSFG